MFWDTVNPVVTDPERERQCGYCALPKSTLVTAIAGYELMASHTWTERASTPCVNTTSTYNYIHVVSQNQLFLINVWSREDVPSSQFILKQLSCCDHSDMGDSVSAQWYLCIIDLVNSFWNSEFIGLFKNCHCDLFWEIYATNRYSLMLASVYLGFVFDRIHFYCPVSIRHA